ncbi:MAG: hypothetical protein K0R24_1592 [Gammaproteobacteria bacterium]|jgi:hypothetical protein|nr:hypothetical protein [Gammaproteobacteria bacterium]MDF3055719.1 hypothetical protein [Gammaproteobacteria bacterium]
MFASTQAQPLDSVSQPSQKDLSKQLLTCYPFGIYLFFSFKENVLFSLINKPFNEEIKKIVHWKNCLSELGLDGSNLLGNHDRQKLISDYRRLYVLFSKLPRHGSQRRNRIEFWELCCLSGEPQAIQYVIKSNVISLIRSRDNDRRKGAMLRYTILSGRVSALRSIVDLLQKNDFNLSDENILSMAYQDDVCTSSNEMLMYVLSLRPVSLPPKLFFDAVKSGALRTENQYMAAAFDYFDIHKLLNHSPRQSQEKLLHTIARKGFIVMLRRLHDEKNIDCWLQLDEVGATVLHSAVMGPDPVPTINYLHSIQVGFLPEARDRNNKTVFDWVESAQHTPEQKQAINQTLQQMVVELFPDRAQQQKRRKKAGLALGVIISSGIAYGLMKSSLLLGICCASMVGVLLLMGFMFYFACNRLHRISFFKSSNERVQLLPPASQTISIASI